MVQIDLRPHGISKPDHVSRPSHEVALQAGSRRGRTSGLSHAVKFAAVHRAFMNEAPALTASVAAKGAWLSVLVYASDKETDTLVGAGDWTDKAWIAATGIDLAEMQIAADAGLLKFVNEGRDVLVLGFDHHAVAAVEAKRAAGKYGILGGRPKNPMGLESETLSSPLVSSDPVPSPPEYPIAFECVWKGTGKRGSKHKAHQAWVKVGKPHWGPVVESAWGAYLKSERPVAGFVQDLSTWLNGRGHTQEWPEATSVAPASSQGHQATCGFHSSKWNDGKRPPSLLTSCPGCRHWAAANRARESLPESSEQMIKRLGLGS